ncbi:unnamed protein product [Arctia plantaginis]|uniref:Mutator-like transposase domain-containing protein n=1 Tax=Arctia plantaginis TaxID=874455 RepID=A0A8S0YX15_ARCPL|nr:unnamed protein product [Arctia plantaginis]CAB3242239.1 unnamed protein product [Arctia plantaginis]
MEVDSMLEMFSRSIEKFGVMYSNYICDGDTKTFLGILNGDKCTVTKNECVGHVQKRMGTRLHNKRKQEKLGGKKRLTEALIKKLTIYYGLAIRRNLNSVEDMRNAIMATLDHYCSTDELPRHDKCPKGVESWCGHTQNANETFNSTVWRIAPKHLNSGIKIVEIAAYIAGGMFNEGYSAVLKTMQLLDLIIRQQCNNFVKGADKERVTRQNRHDSFSSEEAINSPLTRTSGRKPVF